MPNGIQGFIDTFFQVENLKQQRQQQELIEQNSRVERARILSDIGRMTTSEEGREALATLSGDPEFGAFLADLSPTIPTLIQEATVRGFERMGEEERAGLEEVVATRELAGQLPSGLLEENFLQQILRRDPTDDELERLGRARQSLVASGQLPGILARDITFADLPPDDQQRATRITEGLDLSEFERNQIANWAAQNGIAWADLEQRGALGTAGLMAQLRIAEMNVAASGDPNLPSPNTLMSTLTTALAGFADKSLSDTQRLQYVTVFNSAADNLERMGLYPPGVRIPTDPKDWEKSLISIQNLLFGAGGAAVGGGLGALLGGPAGAVVGGLGGFGAGILTGRFGTPQDISPAFVPPLPGTSPATQLLDAQGNIREDIMELLRESQRR